MSKSRARVEFCPAFIHMVCPNLYIYISIFLCKIFFVATFHCSFWIIVSNRDVKLWWKIYLKFIELSPNISLQPKSEQPHRNTIKESQYLPICFPCFLFFPLHGNVTLVYFTILLILFVWFVFIWKHFAAVYFNIISSHLQGSPQDIPRGLFGASPSSSFSYCCLPT